MGYGLIGYKFLLQGPPDGWFVLAEVAAVCLPARTVATQVNGRRRPQFLWISLWTATRTSRQTQHSCGFASAACLTGSTGGVRRFE